MDKLQPLAKWWANLKDFGAVGDGKTDDTKAVQDALDAVSDSSSLETRIMAQSKDCVAFDTMQRGLRADAKRVNHAFSYGARTHSFSGSWSGDAEAIKERNRIEWMSHDEVVRLLGCLPSHYAKRLMCKETSSLRNLDTFYSADPEVQARTIQKIREVFVRVSQESAVIEQRAAAFKMRRRRQGQPWTDKDWRL